jgi:voltage-gated potassium channel
VNGPPVRLPAGQASPLQILSRRLMVALALIAFVTAIAYIERGGYRDLEDVGGVSFLDALYYATVSVTTTGYGDITPVSDGARLTNVLLVTPARILFLILLVGTTVEALAGSSRDIIRPRIWRNRLRDHTIVCGFGTKGRNAIETLRAHGIAADRIVVIDDRLDAIEAATGAGLAAIHASATTTGALLQAGVSEAAKVIVAVDTDAEAVLATLTAREHNKGATIVAAVRESENRHLLHESGADSVIITSGAAGRLMGLATQSPRIVEVLEDLLSVGTGLDLIERDVTPEEEGQLLQDVSSNAPVIGVVRGDELLRFDDPKARTVQAGDRVVCLCSN